MLKQPSDLLREAIQAYAAGASTPTAFLPPSERHRLAVLLMHVCDGVGDLSGVSTAIAQARAMKETFRARMLENDAQAHAEWSGSGSASGPKPANTAL